MKGKCEWCGMVTEVESTSVVGMYCADCHETNIAESKEALKAIRQKLDDEAQNQHTTRKASHW